MRNERQAESDREQHNRADDHLRACHDGSEGALREARRMARCQSGSIALDRHEHFQPIACLPTSVRGQRVTRAS